MDGSAGEPVARPTISTGRPVPAWREVAARRTPAPGGLELVRAFVNTSDIEAGTDALATPAAIEAWLRARGLPAADAGIRDADRDRLLEVREALRDLIACRDAGDAPAAALRVLDQAARSSPLTVAFDPDGQAELRPAVAGVDGVIGRILGEISTAAVAGTWPRLKVCRNDACRWAYYDASRNRSGIWCSMAVCGNRSKGRAFRDRHRGPGGP